MEQTSEENQGSGSPVPKRSRVLETKVGSRLMVNLSSVEKTAISSGVRVHTLRTWRKKSALRDHFCVDEVPPS